MINPTAQIAANFTLCWHCHKKISPNNYHFKTNREIGQQKFSFFSCLNCHNLLYFWQTSQQKFFFHQRKLNVVLLAPEIAGNVGTIIRLAVGFGFQLHLIEPFGFIFSEKWLKRSSINNFSLASIKIYHNWEDFLGKNDQGSFFFTSAKGNQYLQKIDFTIYENPIYFIFGCESKGLPPFFKKKYWKQTVKLVQTNLISSINLANAVSIFSYYFFSQYDLFNLD